MTPFTLKVILTVALGLNAMAALINLGRQKYELKFSPLTYGAQIVVHLLLCIGIWWLL